MLPLLLAAAVTSLATPAPQPGWFVCDGINRPVAWLVGRPDMAGRAAITRVEKANGRTRTATYAVGRADPGAGSIYHALSRGGREVGNLRQLNPGIAADAGVVATPPFTSVTLAGETTGCRWRSGTVAAGITNRRGVSITREDGRLIYRTFDHARPSPVIRPDGVQRSNRPSLEIAGGTERRSSDGRRDFRFVNRGWLYIVSARADGSDGRLTVTRDGRIVSTERFLGLTLAG